MHIYAGSVPVILRKMEVEFISERVLFLHLYNYSQTGKMLVVIRSPNYFLVFSDSNFYCYKWSCNFLSYSVHFHSKRGFDVRSFGTGSHVKLPGPTPDKPNVYDFKTTYVQMYNDLVRKDKELYPLLTHFSTHAHAYTCFTSKTGSQSIHGPCIL